MNADEIPQEFIDILDSRAGKPHSRNGKVIGALAEILTHQVERINVANDESIEVLRLEVAQLRTELTEIRTRPGRTSDPGDRG